MSLVTTMYLIDLFQNACCFIGCAMIISLIVFVVLGILWLVFWINHSDEEAEKFVPWLKRTFVVALIGSFLMILSPSKATVYTFAGMKTIESFMATETGAKMTDDAKQILGDVKTIVHQYVIDLKTEKKEKIDDSSRI